MTAPPRISIVTPSFNQAAYIEETIQSVLAQDFPSWEHIVVDGGSTDGTVEILRRHPHLRWVSEKDRGQCDAVNKGFRMARGEIIGWLNSDDTYRPGALETASREIDPGRGRHVVMGRCEFVDEDGRPTGIFHPSSYRGRRRLIEIWKGYAIPQPAVFFHRDVLERCGMLDESLYLVMDYDLFLRFSRHYWFHQVDAVLATYRLHLSSKTLEISEEELLVRSVEVSRRYWGPRWSPRYWYFARSYRATTAPIRYRANRLWNRALQAYARGRYPAAAGSAALATLLFPPLLWRRGQYPFLELARRTLGDGRLRPIANLLTGGAGAPAIVDGSIFSDGWVSDGAVVRCVPQGVPTHVHLAGEVSLSHFLNAPLRLRLSVQGHDLGEHVVRASGPFAARFDLPAELRRAAPLEVRIQPDKYFVPWELGMGPDRRRLSFLLREIRAAPD